MAKKVEFVQQGLRLPLPLREALLEAADGSEESANAIMRKAIAHELDRRRRGNPHRNPSTNEQLKEFSDLFQEWLETDEGEEIFREAVGAIVEPGEDTGRRAGDVNDEGKKKREDKPTKGRVRKGEGETLADRLGIGKVPLPWSKRKES